MINTSAILDKITIQTARAHCLLIKVNIPRDTKKGGLRTEEQKVKFKSHFDGWARLWGFYWRGFLNRK